MFTGIIQDIGTVTNIAKIGDWVLTIKTEKLLLATTQIGASIACSGICLTVIAKTENSFQVQASSETLNRTTLKNWQIGTHVNLEPALRMGDELGGHLVSGHVDGVAHIVARVLDEDSVGFVLSLPPEFIRFFADKGSVTIDGVSLTVNSVDASYFSVNIIPHTQNATTLGALQPKDKVNIEIDMIARYTERLLRHS